MGKLLYTSNLLQCPQPTVGPVGAIKLTTTIPTFSMFIKRAALFYFPISVPESKKTKNYYINAFNL